MTKYKIADGVTQSLLTAWLACRCRARLMLDGWEAKRQKKSYRFGSLVHATLEHIYNGIGAGRFCRIDSANVDVAVAELIKSLVRANLKTAARSPGEDLREIEMEGVLAEALLCGPYLREWRDDWTRNWIAVETEFDLSWETYRLRGKQDAVFAEPERKGKPARVWLLETKTRSQISEDELSLALAFDYQSLFYLLALHRVLAERVQFGSLGEVPEIAGCLYNIIRVPALRQHEGGKAKRTETDNEFIERIKADILTRPDHYFKRFELVFPPGVVDQFETELREQLIDFQRWTEGKEPTYRNPNACITRYKCEFLEHCASGSFAEYSRTRDLFAELAPPPQQDGKSDAGGKAPQPKRR